MITLQRLFEVLEYNPESGLWVWIKCTNRIDRQGRIAGTVDKKGYVVIQIDRRIYKAHRLAWLFMTGEWPKAMIDHCNGEPADNRWENLREASRSENGANRGPQANSKSGIKGVCWHKRNQKWYAQITENGCVRYLGEFDTKEEAAAAYQSRAIEVHGQFFNSWR